MRFLNYLCMLAPPFLMQAHAFIRPVATRSRCAMARLMHPRHMTQKVQLTVNEVYKQLQQTFEANRISEPEQSARYLISAATGLGMRYSDFSLALDNQLTDEQFSELQKLEKQRLQHVPIQYLVGNWDFCGLTLQVKAPVLIPRPETEELVELITQAHPLKAAPLRILDVGCGTGAIGLALLKYYKTATVVALDISKDAVKLTEENVNIHKLSARHTTIHADIANYKDGTAEGFDIIVSNPPYIPTDELKTLEKELQYEDQRALDGGRDGLDVVSTILRASGSLLKPGGAREVWLEVSNTQPPVITAHATLGKYDTSTHSVSVKEWFRDFNLHPRFVRLEVMPKSPHKGRQNHGSKSAIQKQKF